jgi:ABC-type Mn2+/Zn2+ transport system permease subunit
MHALAEPWTHAFMQRAFLELMFLGVAGGVLGCWVVFYELSYGAESLAHALFPGLVAAALLGLPLLLGASGGVLVAAVGVAVFARTPEIGRDTSIAVVITSLFGAGVLLALAPASPPGLSELLFGDLLGVTDSDLVVAALLAVGVLGGLILLHRQLLTVGFDRSSASALGGRPLLADLALLGALAAAIVIGVQGLGNLLVLAVIVGPAATARLLARRMLPMMALAVVLAVACGVTGLYLSYYADTAGGASVAAVAVGLYVIAWVAASYVSAISRRLANSRKRSRAASSGPTAASSA